MQISVIGAGSWGQALATIFSKIAEVTLWGRSITHDYLVDNINYTNNFLAIRRSDLIIIAVPVAALREILLKISNIYDRAPDIIWTCKGFEAETNYLPHQVYQEVFIHSDNFAALLGPSFAKEVVLSLPTAICLTSSNRNFIKKWLNKLNSIQNFRIYPHNDLIGSEVSSALKNIVAIAVGIVDGLKLGLNIRAALISYSLVEINHLIKKLGGIDKTIYGLTGIGDIILTSIGDLSRNRQVGLSLAQGKSISEINLGHVAEGIQATQIVYNISLVLKIKMPIVTAVYKVLYEDYDLDTFKANFFGTSHV